MSVFLAHPAYSYSPPPLLRAWSHLGMSDGSALTGENAGALRARAALFPRCENSGTFASLCIHLFLRIISKSWCLPVCCFSFDMSAIYKSSKGA